MNGLFNNNNNNKNKNKITDYFKEKKKNLISIGAAAAAKNKKNLTKNNKELLKCEFDPYKNEEIKEETFNVNKF